MIRSVDMTLGLILLACVPGYGQSLDDITLEGYPAWLKEHARTRPWTAQNSKHRRLSRKILQDSLRLGARFMTNNQKRQGNFNYSYDFVSQRLDPGDNAVRQAGALWGLSLIYQHEPQPHIKRAIDGAIQFFTARTLPGASDAALAIDYPGSSECKTGTVALVALGLIDYVRALKAQSREDKPEYIAALNRMLDGYLHHLVSLRLDNGRFSASYSLRDKRRNKSSSPYSDGEVLLCLVKAAKYLDRVELRPVIEESAMRMAKHYTVDQWSRNPDSDLTKGFYQWSSMAFWEYQDAGWKGSEVFGDYVLSMASWMLHVHKTLQRRRNTGYAYEGIVPAYEIARRRGLEDATSELRHAIDTGLYKLTTWQVGGPLQSENTFLRENPTKDPLAVGGFMNHRAEPSLRIDTAQHQLHAVVLALKHVYAKRDQR